MTRIDQPSTLLGGLTPDHFMRHYWQKKPLLIRGALPGFEAPISRSELFALAQREDVESRLVVQAGAKHLARSWTLKRGPFQRRSLPALTQKAWTLLVQGVNLFDARAHDILEKFRFIPRVRLDDLMISYASDRGGVGPHFDSYDVFLLQAQGERRWRIAHGVDDQFVRGAELKILSRFKHDQEWVLQPGDMLYLPPSYAHEGVAMGECMTYSIGFNAPQGPALAQGVMAWMADDGGDDDRSSPTRQAHSIKSSRQRNQFYTDQGQGATQNPGEIPLALQNFAYESYQRLALNEQHFQRALGESLTEPKPHVWFEGDLELDEAQCLSRLKRWAESEGPEEIRLDRQTLMLFDAKFIFINAESVGVSGAEAKILRALANDRTLSHKALAPLTKRHSRALQSEQKHLASSLLDSRLASRLDALLGLLAQWMQSGWLHLED